MKSEMMQTQMSSPLTTHPSRTHLAMKRNTIDRTPSFTIHD
jgi:hypothetical protein